MNRIIRYIVMAMLVLGAVAGCRPQQPNQTKRLPSMDRTAQKSQDLGPTTSPATLPQLRGVNFPGGEMLWGSHNTANPVSGTDYLFVSHQDIDYVSGKGANFARLLFSWEGLQPTPNAAFPTTGNSGTYVSTFVDRVNYATSKGMYVMIEPHGAESSAFAKYKGSYIGTSAVPNSQFADLWSRLATQFKSNPNVVFGLMNEPNGMSTVQWFNAAQDALVAIRATGATNLIMIEGNGWSGAGSWTSSWYDTASPQVSNATAWKIISDPLPLANTVAEVHMYFNSDASGGTNDIVSPTIGVERVKVAVDWARANGVKIHLSEFGATATATNAQLAVTNLLMYLDANKDVVIGWSWWAYGPPEWWSGHTFTLDPKSNYTVDDPKMAWIKSYFISATPPPPTSSTHPSNPIAFTKGTVFTTNSGTTNWVYVPNSYDSTHATPTKLLVWLHGCGGQSQYDVSMVSPGGTQSWISLAVGGAEGGCWNVDTDSVKVLAALADIKTHFNIDPQRVILGGYSSGGDLTYRTAFYNAGLFAGVIVENSSPFRDTGSTPSASIAAASWKFNVAHLLHTGDLWYPAAAVRTELAALSTAGFPVTTIEKAGTHWDNDVGATGTSYDLRTFLLPFLDAGWVVNAPSAAVLPLVVTATKTFDWGTGYCQQFYFKNPNATPLAWKTMTIDLKDGKLRGAGSLWGGNTPSLTVVGTVKVTPVSWTSPVAANTQIEAVGFCADYGASRDVGTNAGLTY